MRRCVAIGFGLERECRRRCFTYLPARRATLYEWYLNIEDASLKKYGYIDLAQYVLKLNLLASGTDRVSSQLRSFGLASGHLDDKD